MNVTLNRTLKRVRSTVEMRSVAVGCQLYVSHKRFQNSVSVGLGAPDKAMTEDTMFRLHCAGKPFIAIAIAVLVSKGTISLEDNIVDYIPEFRSQATSNITIRNVLSHTAGLAHPAAVRVAQLNLLSRHKLVCHQTFADNFEPVGESSYSEYSGWHLLGCIIERVTGSKYSDFLNKSVFWPFGMRSTQFGAFSKSQYEKSQSRMGVFYDFNGDTPTPMLYDRSETLCTEWNPAFGCYGTALDLGLFYGGILKCLLDKEDVILPFKVAYEFSQVSRGRMFDPILDRICNFSLGFMIDLDDFDFGQHISAISFGHVGNIGSTWAFCDPANELVVSMIFNGWSSAEVSRSIRSELIDIIYQELFGC